VFAGHLRAIVGNMTVEEVIDQASAHAHQAGPPADAQAYEQTTLAKAGRDARVAAAEAKRQEVELEAAAQAHRTRLVAEADAVRATGLAEGDAIKARATALLAEKWPAIVEAAAKPCGAVDQLIVLNGAQSLSEVLAQALSQGITGLRMARQTLGGDGGEPAGVGVAVGPDAETE
jgi:hypothetical protein